MRIAFVGQKGFPASWGGIEAHVDAIATSLARRGHDVTVYVREWYSPDAPEFDRGVRIRRLPTLRGKHTDAGVHALLCSLDTLRRRYDVVHYHGIGPALFCWLPRLARRRVVTTVHGLDYLRPKWGRLARAALRGGERAALRFGQRTIVVSNELAAHYGGRVTPLPNAVLLRDPLPADLIRSRLELERDGYLLSLGRWSESKRVPELIEAFRAAAPPHGMRLVVAGGEEPPGACEARIREAARGSPAVVLPGYVTGQLKEELLSNAFGFVTFSGLEGLPVALLEAMGHARACLASDIAPHRELLGGGRGLLRRASTPAQCASAIDELLRLPAEQRSEYGARARAHVAKTHDWERVVDRLEQIYQGIA